MKLLLDTHIILWALDDNPKLPEHARNLILDAENDIYYKMLPITDSQVGMLETLVFHDEHQVHNDPFDRIMVAQAKAEGMKFVTHDSKIPSYNEPCVIAV